MPLNVQNKLALIREVCSELRGPDYCTDRVVQAIAAIARHETGFGTYKPFARPGFESNNWGAQQCGVTAKAGLCPPGCFPATDTSPTATGANIPYTACFLVHPDERTGARSLTKLLTVSRPGIAASLSTGDTQQIAQAMRDAYYYEGFGRTQAERVANYATALQRNATLNAQQAGRELALVLVPPEPPLDPPMTPEELSGFGVAAIFAGLIARLTRTRPETTP